MAVEIKLPVLGEGVDAGTVAGVLVTAGDSVEVDAPLIELETDKAVIEVPATEAGVVASLPVKAGDTVSVGQVIAIIEPGAAAAPSPSPSPEAAADHTAAERQEQRGGTSTGARAAGGHRRAVRPAACAAAGSGGNAAAGRYRAAAGRRVQPAGMADTGHAQHAPLRARARRRRHGRAGHRQ